MLDIIVETIPENEKQPSIDENNLKFGSQFTDYMFVASYNPEKGWHDARMAKYGDLKLSPAAMVLHYGQEIFEGLKAFKHSDGAIHMFRPEMNIKRFNRSAARMVMPEFPEDDYLNALNKLVELEKASVPSRMGSALYIRPTMIATDPFLGVRPSLTYLFYIIASPSGPYFSGGGFDPVKIWVSDQWVRAVRGGVGEAKTGGNYAASLYAAEEAKKDGYAQVLWLDALELKYVEEVGAMNMFFVFDGNTIVTSPLTGSVLEGVTRSSVLELAPELGYRVEEKRLAIDEVIAGIKNGRITEAFGSGTAAAITPVGELCYKGQAHILNDFRAGDVTRKIYDEILGIQYGLKEDRKSWLHKIC